MKNSRIYFVNDPDDGNRNGLPTGPEQCCKSGRQQQCSCRIFFLHQNNRGSSKKIQAEYLETIHQEMNGDAENGADFSEAEFKSELAQEITLIPQG